MASGEYTTVNLRRVKKETRKTSFELVDVCCFGNILTTEHGWWNVGIKCKMLLLLLINRFGLSYPIMLNL